MLQNQQTSELTAFRTHQISDRPDVLQEIVNPDANITIWERPVQAEINRELTGLGPRDLRDKRIPTSGATFGTDVRTFMLASGLDLNDFPHFLEDLQRLADIFFSISKDLDVCFRLVTTDEDDCRRFHVDYRQLRMLCTYQGPGTEWLPEAQVNREELEGGGPNERIIRFGEASHLSPFSVGLMKDDAWPGNKGFGLVHRSPPVAGSGQMRVMFCLDAS